MAEKERMRCLLLLLIVFPLLSKTPNFSGEWEGAMGDGPLYLSLQMEGTVVSGTAGPAKDRQQSIEEAQLNSGTLTFRLMDNPKRRITFTLTLIDNDKLVGTGSSSNGQTIRVKLQRSK